MIRPLASVPIWPRCTSAKRLQRVSWFASDGLTFLADCALRNGRLEIPSITPSSSHAVRRSRRKTGMPAPVKAYATPARQQQGVATACA